jgi:hypothetical protein
MKPENSARNFIHFAPMKTRSDAGGACDEDGALNFFESNLKILLRKELQAALPQ